MNGFSDLNKRQGEQSLLVVKQKLNCQQILLLYLRTQIRFLIGGERVTCHWSKLNDALGRTKLNDALGRTKLNDALGKQQLELWTGT